MTERPHRAATRLAGSDRPARAFEDEFERLFHELHPRIFGYVNRLSGEPDLAADIAQETFVRLHRRGSTPESTVSWLITVATNLLRNARSRSARRRELLELSREPDDTSTVDTATAAEDRSRVHAALQHLSSRDQQLLSLLAGGYSYREMASALGIHEASVGTLLARAKRAFRTQYGASDDTP